MPLLVALATAGVLFMAALLAKANLDVFDASEDGIWFVTLVAMVLLVPASYFGTRFSIAAAAAKGCMTKKWVFKRSPPRSPRIDPKAGNILKR